MRRSHPTHFLLHCEALINRMASVSRRVKVEETWASEVGAQKIPKFIKALGLDKLL